MSTFSGLATASSALAASRRGMDVVGQNIANQNTEGYTRQRVSTSSVAPITHAGRFSVGAVPGQGVAIDGIARLGDALLDARVRDSVGIAGYWSARALAATTAEAALAEPTENGLAAHLSQFWAGWQDLAQTPDSAAAATVVIGSAVSLAERIGDGYRAVQSQWSGMRASVDRTVAQVNETAGQVADLNREIRDALVTGRSANELIDRRDSLVQTLSRLTGARGTIEPDGTMTVRIDGNALVSGVDSRRLIAGGPTSVDAGGRIEVSWAGGASSPISVGSGELGAMVGMLAPDGEGGMLASLAVSYNTVATALANAVNTQHGAGATASGAPGGDFFTLSATGPAALGLSIAIDSSEDLALAAPGAGALDARNADAISQLGHGAGSPDAIWTDLVSAFAVATAGDVQRSSLTEAASISAITAQRSVAAVDGDEETVALLTHQSTYQAAARVLTAIDEALDVLINRTGIVGR